MAMGPTGTSGFQGDINVTPLVDVVLVLLIIFMVVTPVLQMGLDVEIPPKVEVASPPPPSSLVQLVVSVRSDGYYLNQEQVGEATALRDRLAGLLASRDMEERIVFLNAEDKVGFDRAVAAMDVAREAGAFKVGLLTDAIQ
jgi:biopolymer transport protein ExbD